MVELLGIGAALLLGLVGVVGALLLLLVQLGPVGRDGLPALLLRCVAQRLRRKTLVVSEYKIKIKCLPNFLGYNIPRLGSRNGY